MKRDQTTITHFQVFGLKWLYVLFVYTCLDVSVVSQQGPNETVAFLLTIALSFLCEVSSWCSDDGFAVERSVLRGGSLCAFEIIQLAPVSFDCLFIFLQYQIFLFLFLWLVFRSVLKMTLDFLTSKCQYCGVLKNDSRCPCTRSFFWLFLFIWF